VTPPQHIAQPVNQKGRDRREYDDVDKNGTVSRQDQARRLDRRVARALFRAAGQEEASP
jgi:hypothetical protein